MDRGEFDAPDQEGAARISRTRSSGMNRYFGGIKSMRTAARRAVFIIDTPKEHIAVAEASAWTSRSSRSSTRTATRTDLDYPIPSNDDAIRAIKLHPRQGRRRRHRRPRRTRVRRGAGVHGDEFDAPRARRPASRVAHSPPRRMKLAGGHQRAVGHRISAQAQAAVAAACRRSRSQQAEARRSAQE